MEEERYLCNYCGELIPLKDPSTRGRQRKIYCSKRCKWRSSAIRRYMRIKDSKDYKLKQRDNFRKWYLKHREPFIERMSKYQKERAIKMRKLNR